MTPTTDLQKPFTDEQLRQWADLKDKPLLEQFEGLPDWTVLPPLAARVLELEAENKRLREGLDKIVAADDGYKPASNFMKDSFSDGYAEGLYDAAQTARAALKGGEI